MGRCAPLVVVHVREPASDTRLTCLMIRLKSSVRAFVTSSCVEVVPGLVEFEWRSPT